MKHLVALPKGVELKKIDPKYFGETLDPQRRPLKDLEKLQKQWEQEWDGKYSEAPHFYDWVGTVKGSASVLQATAEQRIEYAVHIKDKCLSGTFVRAQHSDYAFVLDSFGTFYAAPKKTSGEIRIHHSTFLGGAPVQCAGVLFCLKPVAENMKEIRYVKEYSGHYQPGIPELLRLKKRLMNLGEGGIHLWYYAGGFAPKYQGEIQLFTGKGPSFTE